MTESVLLRGSPTPRIYFCTCASENQTGEESLIAMPTDNRLRMLSTVGGDGV